jgi:tripartite-type tricarboxylate transporter receptor subunit TctC
MNQMQKRAAIGVAAAGAVFSLGLASAIAQTYPSKPIRLVTVLSAGNDMVARIVSDAVSKAIGQTVIVDNKPGGSGMVGTEAGARAAPDGYTFAITTSGSLLINPLVIAKVPYDPIRDFIPVAMVSNGTSVLVINPEKTPARTVQELVQRAKAAPDTMSYGSFGTGSLPNLLMSIIAKRQGLKLIHVPYKGSPEIYGDLVSGLLSMTIDPIGNALPYIRSGKLRPLAVTSAERHPLLPEVPTLIEAGLVDFGAGTWQGAFLPAGAPKPIVDRLTAAFETALASPEMKSRLATLSLDPGMLTGQRFAEFESTEFERWKGIIQDLGIEKQ